MDDKDEEVKWLMRQNKLKRDDLDIANEVNTLLNDINKRDTLFKEQEEKEDELAAINRKLDKVREESSSLQTNDDTRLFKSVEIL